MKSANRLNHYLCQPGAKTRTLAWRPVLLAVAVLSSVSVLLIRAYQLTRFLRQPSCRFYPSCSQYTVGSIERFGFVRGSLLGAWRILCCHPFHPGGVDEVPSKFLGQFPGIKVTRAIPNVWGDQARGKG